MDNSSLPPESKPSKPIPISSSNGHLHPPPPPPLSPELVYRECLKNHAASLGGHVVDGCGEFMPSPSAVPSDPTSLKCAACGCHRNFHRRVIPPHHKEDDMNDTDSMGEEDDDDENNTNATFSSAPQMLLALSTSHPSTTPVRPVHPTAIRSADYGNAIRLPEFSRIPFPGQVPPRKRFRTKFSAEQKARMQALSERLGWRMQKRDDGLVEECCKEIGVGRGVFKVWMHNNKHNYVSGAARRGDVGSSGSSGGAAGDGGIVKTGDGNNGNNNGNGGNLVVNGASSSC